MTLWTGPLTGGGGGGGDVVWAPALAASGSRVLDDTTCRLIVQRYRFRPAHEADGTPFEAVVVENETWVMREDRERD